MNNYCAVAIGNCLYLGEGRALDSNDLSVVKICCGKSAEKTEKLFCGGLKLQPAGLPPTDIFFLKWP